MTNFDPQSHLTGTPRSFIPSPWVVIPDPGTAILDPRPGIHIPRAKTFNFAQNSTAENFRETYEQNEASDEKNEKNLQLSTEMFLQRVASKHQLSLSPNMYLI